MIDLNWKTGKVIFDNYRMQPAHVASRFTKKNGAQEYGTLQQSKRFQR